MAFRGTYELTLDAKNRLTVPSEYRATLAGSLVVALDPFETCAALWRPDDFERYAASLQAELHQLSSARRNLARRINANAFNTELDGAGRVTLKPHILSGAQLTRDAVIAGVGDCLQVWDRDRYHDADAQAQAQMAEIAARYDHTP